MAMLAMRVVALFAATGLHLVVGGSGLLSAPAAHVDGSIESLEAEVERLEKYLLQTDPFVDALEEQVASLAADHRKSEAIEDGRRR